MKKLLFTLLFALPLFCLAQIAPHTVTTTDGKTYSGEIEKYISKKVIFTKTIPELGEKSIHVADIIRIKGFIKKTRKNAIQKGNPAIEFNDPALENQLNTTDQSPYKYMGPGKYASNEIRSASAMRLAGVTIGLGSLALDYGGVFDDMDHDKRKTLMTVSLVSAVVIYAIGEITLISATKKTNSDAVTLTGAKSGVGLAVNF